MDLQLAVENKETRGWFLQQKAGRVHPKLTLPWP